MNIEAAAEAEVVPAEPWHQLVSTTSIITQWFFTKYLNITSGVVQNPGWYKLVQYSMTSRQVERKYCLCVCAVPVTAGRDKPVKEGVCLKVSNITKKVVITWKN